MATEMTAARVSDILEVQKLLHRCNTLFDAGDAEGWANLFTEDGCFGARGTVVTKDDLRAKVIDSRSRPPHRHYTTNVIIEPDPEDPDRMHAVSCWIYTELTFRAATSHSDPGGLAGIEITDTGTYTDEVVRRNGRWLIQRRTASPDTVLD